MSCKWIGQSLPTWVDGSITESKEQKKKKKNHENLENQAMVEEL